ncbi:tRNA (N(6)-L-threonylcarbamoyladenosine(37)-C(2))-methylthiotransferase MtaB [Anaplasmataceae bacterium AB001_6]|nr:tRNA (N(6)-L-threonylcarbamoyladenosine(37)-C(2))-methylthiotransferase MtaB [Anaplasmataceae bacterium AB001_6]
MQNKGKVITFGCRLNSYESNVIENIVNKSNIADDTVVINSCAVTQDAERSLQRALRRLALDGKKVILTGCASQINKDLYSNYSNVIKIIDNKSKTDPHEYISEDITEKNLLNITDKSNYLDGNMNGRSRAFLKVQDGCDHNCSFCITTIARGRSRSVPLDDIISQVKLFVLNGYSEIVLTGVDLSSYGMDFSAKFSLGELVKKIFFHVPELEQLRLSSLDVAEIDDVLMEEMCTNNRLAPYLHLSIQSGDDYILSKMKRRHRRNDVIKFCHDLRKYRTDCVFGGDFIAGFPTETIEMHQNTIELIKEANITYIHAFPYSERKGTLASIMLQIDVKTRKDRCKELIALGKEQKNLFYKMQQFSSLKVVVEGKGKGRASNFASVKFDNKYPANKDLIDVYIYDYNDDFLIGHVI